MGHDTKSPCKSYQLFEGTCCPYLQGFKVHDPLTQHHIPKPPESFIKWLWKPQNSQQNIYTWVCMGEAEFYVWVCTHFLYSFDIKSSKVHHQWRRTLSLRENLLWFSYTENRAICTKICPPPLITFPEMLRNRFKIFLTLFKQYTVRLKKGGGVQDSSSKQSPWDYYTLITPLISLVKHYWHSPKLPSETVMSFLCTNILDGTKVPPSQLQVWKEDKITQSQIWCGGDLSNSFLQTQSSDN